MSTTPSSAPRTVSKAEPDPVSPNVLRVPLHTVEIVSDSGEGAQKCGQIFGAVSAKMGNGVWTVEIIPAEIQPPPRSAGSASGNRIRVGTGPVTNWGDEANLVVAFNEQALLARHELGALADDCVVLLEDMWAEHDDERIREEWRVAMAELEAAPYRIVRVPMEQECLTITDQPRRGKNMFALGMLAWIYDRDVSKIEEQIARKFRKKSKEVYEKNVQLLQRGIQWASENLDFRVDVPVAPSEQSMVVMNGNQALALGAMAAGMDFMAMYPITPATSVSHSLAEIFEHTGGVLHQAEDEIAAVGAAIGASWAGKVAFTVTSGPGLALKTEAIGLAVMTETPLVVVDVQRGRAEYRTAHEGGAGRSSRQSVRATGRHAQGHSRTLHHRRVLPLHDHGAADRRIAALRRHRADRRQSRHRRPTLRPPRADERWLAAPPDQSPVPEGRRPYDWDERTGLSPRIVPGRPGGMYTTTGLTHDEDSKVRYTPDVNERGCKMRSRKLAVLQHSLKPPPVYGDEDGDLLVVGWGSTKGAIEEAVDRVRAEGLRVSSTHLTFLSPLQPG